MNDTNQVALSKSLRVHDIVAILPFASKPRYATKFLQHPRPHRWQHRGQQYVTRSWTVTYSLLGSTANLNSTSLPS